MKKQYLILAATLFLVTGCGSSTTVQTATTNPSTTAETSASVAPEPGSVRYYEEALKAQEFYGVGLLYSLKKEGVTYEEGLINKTINVSSKIEHLYKSVTTIASLSETGDTVKTKTDVYETADTVYAYNEGDGTYHQDAKARTDFAPYLLSYDYAASTDATVAFKGYAATLSGTIAAGALSAFGETTLTGVTDFAFVTTLSKTEGYLKSFVFTYTMNGFAVKRSYDVSSVEATISLPS
jgi:hypothetical protein